MRAKHAGDFLRWLQTAAHGTEAPVVEKGLRPDYRFVRPEVSEGLLQLLGPGRGQLADEKGMELLPGSPAYPTATAQQRPAHVFEPLRHRLPRRPQPGTLRTAYFVHRLIQMCGDMKAVQHVQRLFRLSRTCRYGFHISLQTKRSPCTTSGPSAFSPRRSVACGRRFPTQSRHRQCLSIW
jgi:hypothetical protein